MTLKRMLLIAILTTRFNGDLFAEEGGWKTDPNAEDYSEIMKRNLQSADSYIPTDNYVHNWQNFPHIKALTLKKQTVHIRARRGYTTVLLFLASWCPACQQLVPSFEKIRKQYSSPAVTFYYIFAHDQAKDIAGFVREYGLPHGVVANNQVLKDFHNPQLPSIYVSDRNGWLLTRYIKATKEDLVSLEKDVLQHRFLTPPSR